MSSCSRVALVTGANKGIGFGIARDLCRLFSGDVVLTARDAERGREAVRQLQAEGLSPRFHALDIDDPRSIRALRDFLRQEYGGLNVLVNNAGIAFKGRCGAGRSLGLSPFFITPSPGTGQRAHLLHPASSCVMMGTSSARPSGCPRLWLPAAGPSESLQRFAQSQGGPPRPERIPRAPRVCPPLRSASEPVPPGGDRALLSSSAFLSAARNIYFLREGSPSSLGLGFRFSGKGAWRDARTHLRWTGNERPRHQERALAHQGTPDVVSWGALIGSS